MAPGRLADWLVGWLRARRARPVQSELALPIILHKRCCSCKHTNDRLAERSDTVGSYRRETGMCVCVCD